MRLTPADTAVVIAAVLHRSNLKRARLSVVSMQKICGHRVHSRFVVSVTAELSELGVTMAELEVGGFGLILTQTLEGAKAIPVSGYVPPDQYATADGLKKLREEIPFTRPDFTANE